MSLSTSDQLPIHQCKDQLTIISGNSWITYVFITSCTFFYGKQRIGPRLKQRERAYLAYFELADASWSFLKSEPPDAWMELPMIAWQPFYRWNTLFCNRVTKHRPDEGYEDTTFPADAVFNLLLLNFSWNKFLKHQLGILLL